MMHKLFSFFGSKKSPEPALDPNKTSPRNVILRHLLPLQVRSPGSDSGEEASSDKTCPGEARVQAVAVTSPIKLSASLPPVPVPETVFPTESSAFSWTVLWDIRRVKIPENVKLTDYVHKMVEKLGTQHGPGQIDPIKRMIAIGNVNSLHANTRNEMQVCGIMLQHVETKGRKSASDQTLLTELCLTALESASPSGIAMLTTDEDFAPSLGRLHSMGHTIIIIGSEKSKLEPLLMSTADEVWCWRESGFGSIDIDDAIEKEKAKRASIEVEEASKLAEMRKAAERSEAAEEMKARGRNLIFAAVSLLALSSIGLMLPMRRLYWSFSVLRGQFTAITACFASHDILGRKLSLYDIVGLLIGMSALQFWINYIQEIFPPAKAAKKKTPAPSFVLPSNL